MWTRISGCGLLFLHTRQRYERGQFVFCAHRLCTIYIFTFILSLTRFLFVFQKVSHVLVARDVVISLGPDRMLVSWKAHCHPRLHMTQLCLYYIAGVPLRATTLGLYACVAYTEERLVCVDDARRRTHPWAIELCSSIRREELTHHHQFDHHAEVTDIAPCVPTRVFASSSLDHTIKLWSETNELVSLMIFSIYIDYLYFYYYLRFHFN